MSEYQTSEKLGKLVLFRIDFCSVRRKRFDLRARLQHMGLHAHVFFLIRLISRFQFRLVVEYVQLLWIWHVPVRGLLTLSAVLWLSSDLPELSKLSELC